MSCPCGHLADYWWQCPARRCPGHWACHACLGPDLHQVEL
jgi:hypothetical protein